MTKTLSSYALLGLNAVPVDVVVDEDQARVVEPETGRCLACVTRSKPGPGRLSVGSGVRFHFVSAPARLSHASSPQYHLSDEGSLHMANAKPKPDENDALFLIVLRRDRAKEAIAEFLGGVTPKEGREGREGTCNAS